MPNADNLRVYVDQNQIAYNLTSNEASWIITFTYHHSTHQVRIYYSANTTEAVPRSIVIATGIILGITFTAAVCLIVWLAKKSKNSDG